MQAIQTDAIVGCTDGWKRGYIEGWAWRPYRPHDKVVVELLVNGVLTGEATACMHRPDLGAAGIGEDGHHAFAIPFAPKPEMQAVLHLTVRAKDGPVLRGGEFDFETLPEARANLAHRRSLGHLEHIFGPLAAVEAPTPRAAAAPAVPRLNFILSTGGAGTPAIPDSSYEIVMKSFREALRRLGVVHIVHDAAAEADAIYDACMARGETCILLSFAPPQRTPLGLRCPTIPVIDWEFSTIPTGGWPGDAREDWRLVLRHTGRAMTMSDFAARAVRTEMGATYPVALLPTPIWDRLSPLRARLAGAEAPQPGGPATLSLNGFVWDSRIADLSIELDKPPMPDMPRCDPPRQLPMRGAQLALAIASKQAIASAAAADAVTEVPHTRPPPASLRQRVRITLRLSRQWYRDVVRDLLPDRLTRAISFLVRAGLSLRPARPTHVPAPHAPVSRPSSPTTDSLALNAAPEPAAPVAMKYVPAPDAAENRLANPPPRYLPAPTEPPLPEPELAIFSPDPYPAPRPAPAQGVRVHVDGLIFTAVLAPSDEGKNWPDILTAFIDALGHDADATLVLTMVGNDPTYWWWELSEIARGLPPFSCRVLVLSGFLDNANYQALIAATHFVVNASRAEGQCLPLVEFMSGHRPAIAPLHTAMLDYITPENAIIVASSPEICSWPHDPRNRLTTTRHRIEWPSLRDAFQTAADIVRHHPARYAAMQQAAATSMQNYCAYTTVIPRLAAFLGLGDEAVRRAGCAPLPTPPAESLP